MTTFSATIRGVNVTFKHNPAAARNDNPNVSTPQRVHLWLDGFLDSQEGIFRISKLVRDVCGFSGQLVANTQFAWVTAWTSMASKVADYSFNGTNLPHAYTSIKSLGGIMSEQRLETVVKKVSDFTSALMFAAMLVVNAPLGTAANLVVLAGDAADLVIQTKELRLVQLVAAEASDSNKAPFTNGVTTANVNALGDMQENSLTTNTRTNGAQPFIHSEDENGRVNFASSVAMMSQANFLQMLKTAKVVVGVFGGVLFVGQLFLPAISTYAVVTVIVGVCKSKMLAVTLSVASSVLAVYANYYKTTMVWQIDKISQAPAVPAAHAHAQ
jgi:hypothetical protein